MPLLKIHTNQALDPETRAETLASASSLVSRLLEKPEKYVMISLHDNTPMSFGGTGEPVAHMELFSLGLPEHNTPALSASLCEFARTRLGIPEDRVYIRFENPPRHMWGWNGATFG